MKIRCESCRTRYEIPDERVVGRVLRVRCKRCEKVLEVVGPTAAFEAARDTLPPTLTGVQAFSSGDATGSFFSLESRPIWWAAISGKPHGPYSRDEVLALIARGDVHARTRLWRSPWLSWARVCESAALRWAYEAVVAQVGHDVAALKGEPTANAFARAGLISDGESWFPDPTLKSGWVVLDDETQRYLETCAARGALAEAASRPKKAPLSVVLAERGSLGPALAAACTGAAFALGGALLLAEPVWRLLS
jgi:predicted Zn finger-like uncharacterized protein